MKLILPLIRAGLAGVMLPGLLAAPVAAAEALALNPENPHYFLFRGKPTVLISSGEHYGAVINLDFNYVKYFTALERDGLNGTRTWVGACCEASGDFQIARNTLAPMPDRFRCPWARSDQPGYANGGNKFDLNKWDNAYFKRLKDFVNQAGKRGIIVEVNLFCPFYEETMWRVSPMNVINNANRLGDVARTNVYTLDQSGGLLPVQEALVRKVVRELNQFDNVYYELCNEPYFGGVTLDWQRRLAGVITESEKGLGPHHLISQNIANGKAKIEHPHPAVSIFNFHYASPPDAVAMNYDLNKVIGDNETGFRGTDEAPYRMEAWDFIVAGGGLFNNLDYSFTAGCEDGSFALPASQPGGGGPALRRQLRLLAEFIQRFDFVHMHPENGLLAGNVPAGLTARVLAKAGQEYVLYLRSAPQNQGGKYPKMSFTNDELVLEVKLPAAEYVAEWFDTKDGSIARSQAISGPGGVCKLAAPAFQDDIALSVRQSIQAPGAPGRPTLGAKTRRPPKSRAAPAVTAPAEGPPPEPATPEQPPVAVARQESATTSPSARASEPPRASSARSDHANGMAAGDTVLGNGPGTNKLDPAAPPPEASQGLPQQLLLLNEFVGPYYVAAMQPANGLLVGALPTNLTAQAMGAPAQGYVIYLHLTSGAQAPAGPARVRFEDRQMTLDLALPRGEYDLRWFDTKQGLILRSEHLTQTESVRKLGVPAFENDLVLSLRQSGPVKPSTTASPFSPIPFPAIAEPFTPTDSEAIARARAELRARLQGLPAPGESRR